MVMDARCGRSVAWIDLPFLQWDSEPVSPIARRELSKVYLVIPIFQLVSNACGVWKKKVRAWIGFNISVSKQIMDLGLIIIEERTVMRQHALVQALNIEPYLVTEEAFHVNPQMGCVVSARF